MKSFRLAPQEKALLHDKDYDHGPLLDQKKKPKWVVF